MGVSLSMIKLSDGRLASSFDNNAIVITNNFDFYPNKTNTILRGHRDFINTLVEYSSTVLASGSCDMTIMLWNLSTQTNFTNLTGHFDCITSLIRIPKYDLLISGSSDKTILAWYNMNLIHNLTDHTDWVQALAYSPIFPDQFASASLDKTIKIWTINSNANYQFKSVGLSTFTSKITAIKTFSDNSLLIGHQNGLVVQKTDSGVQSLNPLHSDSIIAFSVVNSTFFLSASSQEIKIWTYVSSFQVTSQDSITFQDKKLSALATMHDLIFAGYESGKIEVWNLKKISLANSTSTDSHAQKVTVLKVYQNSFILTGSLDKSVRVWEFSQSKLTLKGSLTTHTSSINAITILKNNQILSSSNDFILLTSIDLTSSTAQFIEIRKISAASLDLLELADGNIFSRASTSRVEIRSKENLNTILFTKDVSTSLAILTSTANVININDNTAETWSIKTLDISLSKTLTDHTDGVSSLGFYQDKYLLSGSIDTSIKVWDFATLTLVKTLSGHSDEVTVLTSLNNGLFASGSLDNTIIIWDKFYVKLYQLKNHEGRINSLINFNQTHMVSASADTSIIIWQTTSTMTHKQTLLGHGRQIEDVTALLNGDIVTASDDFTLKLWNASSNYTNSVDLTAHTNNVYSVTTLKSGYFASSSKDRSVIVWNPNNFSYTQMFGHLRSVICVTNLTDDLLASGSCDRNIIIWDLSIYDIRLTIEGHTDCVNTVAELDSQTLISGSDDGTIRVWQSTDKWISYKQINILNATSSAVNSIATHKLRPNLFASGHNDSIIYIYERNAVGEFNFKKSLTGHKDSILDVKFLNNGNLASCSKDKTIKVWDMNTYECIFSNMDHARSVIALFVLVNGDLVTGSEDKSIKIINTDLYYNKTVIY